MCAGSHGCRRTASAWRYQPASPASIRADFLAGQHDRLARPTSNRLRVPDFYIGAHAAIARCRLLTRDSRRYRTYFPTVELIAPEADREA